jgi:hypothetical protein
MTGKMHVRLEDPTISPQIQSLDVQDGHFEHLTAQKTCV